MSLTGFNSDGTATINGLTTMSANIMNSDEMFYDSSTIPVNVKTAIDGITIDVTAAEADIVVLQGQMTTANSNISTLQGQFSTLNGEVNTLQSEMNDAQADIGALYGITTTNTAAIAGLVISQAAQDVTIAAHTVSIATLNGDVSTLQGQVSTLQIKTTDQSWGSLSGTTFSGRVNVGTTSAGVSLYTGSASEFGSGILTPSIEPLAITSNLAIGATQTTGTLNIGTLSTRSGAINFGTGASAKTISLGSSASTVAVNGTTTIAGTTNINTTSLTNTNIGNGAAGGNFTVNAAVNTITGTTNTLTSTGDAGINCDQLLITATTTTNKAIIHTSSTSADDFSGVNSLTGAYGIRLSATGAITGGLLLNGGDSGISSIDAVGSAHSLDITAGADIDLTATDVTITTTGTSAGEFVVRSNTNVDIATTTGNIELFANTTMLIKSGGTNTTQVDGTNKIAITTTTTTLDNTTFTINANTAVNVDNTFNMMPTATIIQNVSATVPAGFLYCNGQAVSRTVTYARLFAAIGTTFGVGNGTTTFNVPNFQGAFLRGAGNQTVAGTVHTANAVGTAQDDDVLKHIHTYSDLYWYDDTSLPAGTTRSLTGTDYQVPGGDTVGLNADGGHNKVMTSSAVYAEGATQANEATTPSLPIGAETRPMNYSVYYYIRY